MSSLADIRNAITKVSTAPQANDEAWRAMWTNFNFGDLLAPSPLSIALLSSVLLVTSGDKDMSLLTDDSKPTDWTFLRTPDSFKSSALQLVGEGYATFESNHASFTALREITGAIPENIKLFLQLLSEGQAAEVAAHGQTMVDDVARTIGRAVTTAEKIEKSFDTLIPLCQELLVGVLTKSGNVDDAVAQREINLAVAQARKEALQSQINLSTEAIRNTRTSFAVAQAQFNEAVQHLPAGWELVGSHVIESLTTFVINSANSVITAATLSYTAKMMGANAAAGVFSPKPSAPATTLNTAAAPSPVPSEANVTDLGAAYVAPVLAQVSALKTLLYSKTGVPADDADWDSIPKAGQFVKTSLTQQRKVLDATKPISRPLMVIINACLPIIDKLLTFNLQNRNPQLVAEYRKAVDAYITQLQGLSTTARLVTQTQGTIAQGFLTNFNPSSPTKPSTDAAISTAKFKVDQTVQLLQASNQAYKSACEERKRQQAEITKAVKELAALKVVQGQTPKIVPLLRKIIACYLTQQAQQSQITQLLKSVQSIMTQVSPSAIEGLTQTLQSGDESALSGVTVANFQKNIVYQQTMSVLKVATLVSKISDAYVTVSNDFILPAQRKIHEMMQFPQGAGNAADDLAFVKRLETKQTEVLKSAEATSEKILSLIGSDQTQFASALAKRTDDITNAVKGAYPGVTGPPPANLAAVTKDYVQQVATKEAATVNEVTQGLTDLQI